MAYDVFISYSSKNKTAAHAVCHELEDNGVKCWMAPRDIPVGAKYASVITQAIKGCKAVVLVFSEQSALSPWVESEINIAFSNRKTIVPYKIDEVNLANYDEFYLMLNNRHWIESYPDFKTRFRELVSVVSRLVGVEVMSAKAYKVGDYYDDGTKQGVVFEVSADGKHGKIVSLTESTERLEWSSDDNEQERLIGADDKYNGANNMAKVKQIPGWRKKYPAFAWCADLGEGWYLPAIEELGKFTLDDDVRNAVNRALAAKGEELANQGKRNSYRSSTEKDEFFAWNVLMYRGGNDHDYCLKGGRSYVRAVSAF